VEREGGGDALGAEYGFVTTRNREDLGTLLLQKGLARTHGVGRETPDGTPKDETLAKLKDIEAGSMLKRVGVWAESDTERIVKLREKQRREERELTLMNQELKEEPSIGSPPFDLNSATREELESVNGIGPVFASRIIAGLPYQSVNDLAKIKGIGKKSLKKFRDFFYVKGQIQK
jgi:competence protein ComEA